MSARRRTALPHCARSAASNSARKSAATLAVSAGCSTRFVTAGMALRMLSRNPVFAIAAVLSLGIGIGANTAMFSVVDALLLKKLPVPQPDGLVHFIVMTEPPYRRDDVPYNMFVRLREGATSFSSMAGVSPVDRANLTVDAAPRDAASAAMTRVGLVTGDYFATLGVDASIGRVLGPGDDGERPDSRRQRCILAIAHAGRSESGIAHAASQRRRLRRGRRHAAGIFR